MPDDDVGRRRDVHPPARARRVVPVERARRNHAAAAKRRAAAARRRVRPELALVHDDVPAVGVQPSPQPVRGVPLERARLEFDVRRPVRRDERRAAPAVRRRRAARHERRVPKRHASRARVARDEHRAALARGAPLEPRVVERRAAVPPTQVKRAPEVARRVFDRQRRHGQRPAVDRARDGFPVGVDRASRGARADAAQRHAPSRRHAAARPRVVAERRQSRVHAHVLDGGVEERGEDLARVRRRRDASGGGERRGRRRGVPRGVVEAAARDVAKRACSGEGAEIDRGVDGGARGARGEREGEGEDSRHSIRVAM